MVGGYGVFGELSYEWLFGFISGSFESTMGLGVGDNNEIFAQRLRTKPSLSNRLGVPFAKRFKIQSQPKMSTSWMYFDAINQVNYYT